MPLDLARVLAAAAAVTRVINHNSRVLAGLARRIDNLEERMSTVEQQTWDEIGTLVGLVEAEVMSLRQSNAAKDAALEAARAELADADVDAQQKVDDALALDSQADTDRAVRLVQRLRAVVPVEVPAIDVPPPGEPAELPDGSTSDELLDQPVGQPVEQPTTGGETPAQPTPLDDVAGEGIVSGENATSPAAGDDSASDSR